MKTKALTTATLIACFTAFAPVMAQTATPQGGMGGTGTSSGTAMSGKSNGAGKNSMADTGAKGSAVVNEKSSSTDAGSTATQGGGSSPMTTGEGMKQPSKTAR